MRYVIAIVTVLFVLPLAGCSTGSGSAINGSGNLIIEGDFTVMKAFMNCLEHARSGITTASESSSGTDGKLDVEIVAQGGGASGSTAATFVGQLAALDECLRQQQEDEYSDANW